MINTKPLGSHKTLADYASFLFRRHAVSQFSRGTKEVHIVFDNHGRLANTPKYFTQKRCDATIKVPLEHYCDDLQGDIKIPHGKWQENLLSCQDCKRRLVTFLGSYFLNNVGKYLQVGQIVYVAGSFEGETGDTAWFVCGQYRQQPDPVLNCSAEETDSRIWVHATKSIHRKILNVSPDTDVYHIGLLLPCVMLKEIIVQVNAIHSSQLKLLNLTAFVNALKNDPDFTQIDPSILPKVFQTLNVVSG